MVSALVKAWAGAAMAPKTAAPAMAAFPAVIRSSLREALRAELLCKSMIKFDLMLKKEQTQEAYQTNERERVSKKDPSTLILSKAFIFDTCPVYLHGRLKRYDKESFHSNARMLG